MFFTFPEDARWNPDHQAVEFGVSIGEYEGVVRVPRDVFRRFIDGTVKPERCIEAYHLQRTRFELIAERKLRRRQLTDDANVEITGRDLQEREAAGAEHARLSGFRRRSHQHLSYRGGETRTKGGGRHSTARTPLEMAEVVMPQ
jgi:hypothetical protein